METSRVQQQIYLKLDDAKPRSCNLNRNERRWRCRVCHNSYNRNEAFCLSCFQDLYYYCYVNNNIFVTKDNSYLEIYF